jgi:hypothetical protein
MKAQRPSPLQASFWLTEQEKRYILVICAVILLGVVARHYYLKNEIAEVYTPAGIEEMESDHE